MEFWVAIRNQNRVLRGVTLIALLTAAAMALAVLKVSRRPPFVVRVGASGEARLLSGEEGPAQPDLAEARLFASDFLKRFLAPSSASVTKDLSWALAMMTPELQKEHAEAFRKNSYVRNVEKLQIETSIFFGEIVARKEGEIYGVTADGIIETRKRGVPVPVRRRFSTHLALTPIARNHWNFQGLLVAELKLAFDSAPRLEVWEGNESRPFAAPGDDAM